MASFTLFVVANLLSPCSYEVALNLRSGLNAFELGSTTCVILILTYPIDESTTSIRTNVALIQMSAVGFQILYFSVPTVWFHFPITCPFPTSLWRYMYLFSPTCLSEYIYILFCFRSPFPKVPGTVYTGCICHQLQCNYI